MTSSSIAYSFESLARFLRRSIIIIIISILLFVFIFFRRRSWQKNGIASTTDRPTHRRTTTLRRICRMNRLSCNRISLYLCESERVSILYIIRNCYYYYYYYIYLSLSLSPSRCTQYVYGIYSKKPTSAAADLLRVLRITIIRIIMYYYYYYYTTIVYTAAALSNHHQTTLVDHSGNI